MTRYANQFSKHPFACFLTFHWLYGQRGLIKPWWIQMCSQCNIYIYMKAPSVFCHKQQGFCYLPHGFSSQESPWCFLASIYFPPSKQWFCVCTAIFFTFLFDGWHMNADQSQGQKRSEGLWMVKQTHWLIFFLVHRRRFWQDNNILEDSLLSQSFFSTCTECCWLEFNQVREFLERVGKNFQTDRRQQRPSGDLEGLHLIVTVHRSHSRVKVS